MTKIQQAVLVESPASEAYRLWSDVRSYPAFFEGVANIAPVDERTFSWHSQGLDGVEVSRRMMLVEDEAPRRLLWQSDTAPDHECLVTFASLEGDACWMVLNMEFEFDSDGAEAGEQHRAERLVRRALLNAREIIEADYERSGKQEQRSASA